MAEEPEDFKGIEDKFKLSILQADKRLVDLEIAVSELQRIIETPMEADQGEITLIKTGLEDLKQRFGDIEDLIMVEQAGILELKKMMDGKKAGAGEDESLLKELSNINEKIAVIEDKIHAVKTFTTEDGKEIDPHLVLKEFSALKDEVHDNVEKRLAILEDKIHAVKSFSGEEERTKELEALRDKMQSDLTVLRGDLENKAVELRNMMNQKIEDKIAEQIGEIDQRPVAPGLDVDFVNKKIESFKETVEEVEKGKMDSDARLRVLEKNMADIDRDIKRSTSNKVLKELDNTKKDGMVLSSKIESTEKIIRMLTEDVRKMEKNVKKFESFERLRHLNKEVEDKIERFKFIEDELRRLSSRMEMMYSGIDDRIEKFKDLDKKMERMQEFFPGVAEQLDKNRLDILSLTKQGKNSDEFKNKMRRYEGEMTSIRASISSLEKAVKAIASSTRKPAVHMKMKDDFTKKIEELEDRIDHLQGESEPSIDPKIISRIESNVDVKIKEMENRSRSMIDDIRNSSSAAQNANQKIKQLEQRNRQMFDQLRNSLKSVQSSGAGASPSVDISREVEARVSDLDAKIRSVDEKIQGIQQRTGQMIEEVRKSAQEGKEVKVADVNVEEKMKELEHRNAKYLQQLKQTFDERSARIIQELKKAGGEAVVIESKIDELEKRNRQLMNEYKRSVEEQLKQSRQIASKPPAQATPPPAPTESIKLFESQIDELLDRLVFLESRLAAVEKVMTSTYNKKPIVLE